MQNIFVESLQVHNQCSVIHELLYAFIWFIYMILCTHILNTMHVNKFGNTEMNTHGIFVSAIVHNQNICTDLLNHMLIQVLNMILVIKSVF
jgi:hypothetical protein